MSDNNQNQLKYIHSECDGSKYWNCRLNGDLHRIDGPAIEHKNGIKGWYLNDRRCLDLLKFYMHQEYNVSDVVKVRAVYKHGLRFAIIISKYPNPQYFDRYDVMLLDNVDTHKSKFVQCFEWEIEKYDQ